MMSRVSVLALAAVAASYWPESHANPVPTATPPHFSLPQYPPGYAASRQTSGRGRKRTARSGMNMGAGSSSDMGMMGGSSAMGMMGGSSAMGGSSTGSPGGSSGSPGGSSGMSAMGMSTMGKGGMGMSATTVPPPPPVTLSLFNADVFNPRSPATPTLVILIENGVFDTTGPVTFSLNGVAFDPARLTVTPTSVTVSVILLDGINTMTFTGVDSNGNPLELTDSFAAGAETLTVNLLTEAGSPYTLPATVALEMADDNSVVVTATTTTGSLIFSNVPARTIIASARGDNNDFGTNAVLGTDGVISITLVGFGSPSTVDNNDFGLGTTAGWTAGPTSIITHDESAGPSTRRQRREEDTSDNTSHDQGRARHGRQLVNNDLVLSTNGVEGPSKTSRTFTSEAGVVGVTVRYRFVTSEVPGGWFGSQYNDFFSVTIRSQNGGGLQSETDNMNNLGLAAFDAGGSTAWRYINLPLDCNGDTVQVDITVANVGDQYFDSYVIVDFVEEIEETSLPSCTVPGNAPATVVLAIGPIDALTANSMAQEAGTLAAASGLIGAHNGPKDAFRHCAWHCLMTREIGADQAKEVGDLYEACTENNPCDEKAMDLHNNLVGVNLGATQSGDCSDLCLSAVASGTTFVFPQSRWNG